MVDFRGQVAVVTGAGRGLGRHYALELARRGARVVVNDVGGAMNGSGSDAAVADAVVEEIRSGGGVAVASYDSVETPEGGAAIVRAATEKFGRLDAVISNAGIYEMVRFEDLTAAQWQRMRAVHLDGGFYVCQPAFRVMKDQGYGRIVFVTSNIAAFGLDLACHYAAAKGGLIGLTNALANAGAPHGVQVNAVLPVAETRMMTESLGDAANDPMIRALFDETTPERVVPLVVFLASRDCSLTHQLFSAAAGRYARVFLGLAEGRLFKDAVASVEDIAMHLADITATEPYVVPGGVADEIAGLLERLALL